MPRASLYPRIGEDRHSCLYNYSSGDSYVVPASSTYYSRSVSRARSISREPSVSSLRSSSLTYGRSKYDDINVIIIYKSNLIIFSKINIILSIKKEASDKLESANKSYHEMHAQFLSKRWENKHVYCGIQDHVCSIRILTNTNIIIIKI